MIISVDDADSVDSIRGSMNYDEAIELIMAIDREWSAVDFTHRVINKLLDSLYHDVDIKMDNTQAGRPFILVRDRGKFDHGWECQQPPAKVGGL